MKPFAFRSLPFFLVLLLVGCQSSQQQSVPPLDELVIAFRELDLSLAEERLDDARSQFSALQSRASGDTRLEQYQRQLADAYMEQGREALQQGDLDRAAQALGQARGLMPQAPALSHDLNQAIDGARAARQARAASATTPASEPAPAVDSQPKASLIDPSATTTSVALPMLDSQDGESLRRLLDNVAADVVTFRCAVRIEVRQARDYPWVAALLSARIKKLDPSFRPQLSQTIAPQQVPRLLLSPQRQ